MAGRKSNAKGRSASNFVMLRFDMMDSPAWRSLSLAGKCVWLEIMRRYNGYNNGEIPLSCRDCAERLGISKDTASKAFNELQDRGFIRIGQDSAFNVKYKISRRWIITHEVYAERSPTNGWKEWSKNKTRSDLKDT